MKKVLNYDGEFLSVSTTFSPYFICVDPDQNHYSEYGSRFTKLLNTDLIWNPDPQH